MAVKTYKGSSDMYKIILFVLWAGLIFIFTCTARMEDIFESYSIMFDINPNPIYSELLSPLPSNVQENFIIRKMGHGFCFFIFTLILGGILESKIRVFIYSFLYAAVTEIFQLYFNRDGRLFDIGFDTLGILAAIILLALPTKQISLTRKSQT
jgi:VanZ family protein